MGRNAQAAGTPRRANRFALRWLRPLFSAKAVGCGADAAWPERVTLKPARRLWRRSGSGRQEAWELPMASYGVLRIVIEYE